MRINTVFFDIDDTLINHSGSEEKALMQMRKKYFREISSARFKQIWRTHAKKNWALFEINKLTFQGQRIERVKGIWRELGKGIEEEQALRLFNQYHDIYENSWETFPKVPTAIKKMHKNGIRIGVISNNNKDQQLRKLKAVGLIQYFDNNLILVSDEAGVSKPDPRFFKLAQKVSDSSPEELLMVGDDVTFDLNQPKKLGWNVLLVNHFSNDKETDFNNILGILDID